MATSGLSTAVTGVQWDQLIEAAKRRPARIKQVIDRDLLLSALAGIRAEWQQAAEAEGKPLAEMTGSVGLLLADFAGLLEVTPEEAERVLGPELANAEQLHN